MYVYVFIFHSNTEDYVDFEYLHMLRSEYLTEYHRMMKSEKSDMQFSERIFKQVKRTKRKS